MTVRARRLDPGILEYGLQWSEYLEINPRAKSLQLKRYNNFSIKCSAGDPVYIGFVSGVILTEPACPDCIWAVPKLVRALEDWGIESRLFFRSDWPDLQELLLTNGKRSVPKLALISASGEILAEWGPRPKPIQAYVSRNVSTLDRSVWMKEVLKYYKNDGDRDLRAEISEILGRTNNPANENP